MLFKLVCKPYETEQEARERFADVYFNADIGYQGIYYKLMQAQTLERTLCAECFAGRNPAAVLFYRLAWDPDPGQPRFRPGHNPIYALPLCPEHDAQAISALLCNRWELFCERAQGATRTIKTELSCREAEPLFIITLGLEDYGNYEVCFVRLMHRIQRELAGYFEAKGYDRANISLIVGELDHFHIEEQHTEAEIEALINGQEAQKNENP